VVRPGGAVDLCDAKRAAARGWYSLVLKRRHVLPVDPRA
jgi:hypothetical protein